MNIVTKYPILVNPVRPDVNDYKLNDPKFDLPGAIQKVAVGDFVIKGTNPVFENDKEVTQNEFMYLKEIDSNGQVLTPMDEYLYSGRNYSDGAFDFGEFTSYGDTFSNLTAEERRARRQSRRASRLIATTTEEIKQNLQDIPGGPTKAEQEAKLKEGKFWNTVKGAFDSFKTSPSGQILIDSATTYLSNKLGGNSFSQQGGPVDETPPAAPVNEPMSATTKYVLIGGGVLLVGIIAYSVLSKK